MLLILLALLAPIPEPTKRVPVSPYPRVVVPNRPGWCHCPDCGGTGKGGDYWSDLPQNPHADCEYCHGTGIWKLSPPPHKMLNATAGIASRKD